MTLRGTVVVFFLLLCVTLLHLASCANLRPHLIENEKNTKKSLEQIGLGVTRNPDTVDELDIKAYLGLWYQMYADAVVVNTFEKDAYCDTALYGDNGNGTLSVHNYAKTGSPDGETYVIDGYAFQSNMPDEPGQLKVAFDSDEAAPFPAPYWILELGPINANGLYDWAIVSDNLSYFLFVLARDPQEFYDKYDAEVQGIMDDLGFTGHTKPIPTYQGSDCVYE